MSRRVPKSLVILSGWTVFGLYMALQDYSVDLSQGREASLNPLLLRELCYSTCWALLTPLMLSAARRYPIDKARWARHVPLHLFLSIIVSLVQKGAFGISFGAVRSVFLDVPFSWESQLRNLPAFVDYGIVLYWMVLGLRHAVDYYRKYQENSVRAATLEAQLAHSQLQALKMQLQPHFLFNTLNSISVLVTKDPEKARKTVGWLSDLLRLTLEQGSAHEVSLATELKFLERYLAIEKTRFADRLTVHLSVDDDATDARVPTLILQPLVENAIMHGVARRRGPTRIDITARRVDSTLVLVVRNESRAGSKTQAGTLREGVGLSNTRARLDHLYGTASNLRVMEDSEGRVSAEVILPYREGKE